MLYQRLRRFSKVACTSAVVSKAFKIALVVGTILNLINQGDSLIAMEFSQMNTFKLVLTYVVPYSVTTYTAVSLKLEFLIGSHAAIDVELECQGCHKHIYVKEKQIVPECPSCKVQTHWKVFY